MKKIIISVLMIVSCLPSLLGEGQGVRPLFGHQDDPFYGIGWDARNGGKTCSDVKRVSGRYPAVMGFELSGLDTGHSRNIDGVPFTLMAEEIQNQLKRGGTVTLSWHPDNIVTGKNAWDVTDTTVVKSVLPGGRYHDEFIKRLSRVALFIKAIGAPVIFRPWHENNGSWFWWGKKLCSAADYKALWNMTQDYFINVAGLKNLTWSYSPNFDTSLTEEDYLTRYPGDDRVQLLGLDAYQDGGREDYQALLNQNLNMLCQYASRHGKQVALTECGFRGKTPDPTWWTGSLLPVIRKYPLVYVLCWRNGPLDEHECFGPYRNSPDSKDFKKFSKYVKLIR